jgi:GntP family gluconate:H+ symporter
MILVSSAAIQMETAFCLAAATPADWWPFAILAICIAVIVLLITKFRLHPFLALLAAAFLAGFLTKEFSPQQINRLPAILRADAEANSWIAAVELTAIEFGNSAGTIAISIGLAAIIGLALMESGAADKVVRRFLATFGEKRAAFALLASTYVLSIPIFFDTMFMLMAPLARALRLRTGKDYLLYVMAICIGGVVTHSLTVPHPGPLGMVSNLQLDAGFALLWGLVAGLLPCLGGYYVAVLINRRMNVPLRETPGVTLVELDEIARKPESELPSFLWSVLPVLLPIGLITFASLLKVAQGWSATASFPGGLEAFQTFSKIFLFLGNKNIALLIGTVIALGVMARQRHESLTSLNELLGKPVETAGVIIVITAAGGAFGAMLRNAGVGDAIKSLAEGYQMNLIVLSFLVAMTLRLAQGSATVAMLTTSAMMFEVIQGVDLAFNPMYLLLSIGFGAFSISWMNDSGFWVVSRLAGFTEREMLRSWTVATFATAIIGFIQVLIFSKVLPLK